MKKADIGAILATIPQYVSDAFYTYMGEKNRKPRFDTVFKEVKVQLKYDGIDFKKCDEMDKEEIRAMALDVFEGLRDAGF